MYEVEEHLAPLPNVGKNSLSDGSDSDDDSGVEITSTIDENENELIKWTNYLQLNSDDDEDTDEDVPSTQFTPLVDYSLAEPSSDDDNLLQSSHQPTSSNNNTLDSRSTSSSTIAKKRKRRQWTVAEKLHAIACFEKSNIKRQIKSDVLPNNFECGLRTRMNYLNLHLEKKVSNTFVITM
jgi:hypothetical protein